MSTRFIRYATPRDADALGRVHSESLHAAFRGIIPDAVLANAFSVQKRTACFERELSCGAPKTALIMEGDTLSGLITFGECRIHPADSWTEIWRLYISPSCWGNGMAQELMSWGIDVIHKQNGPNIELWVLEENARARRFYEKMGFRHDGTVRTILMGKALREMRYIQSVT